MKRQLCAALLASSLLTTSLALAEPTWNKSQLGPVVPISAPVLATERATVTIGNAGAIINGKAIKLPFAPYINKGVTMVPLEALAQFLNTRPSYNPKEDSVTIHHQGKNMVSFRLGEAEIRLGNGTLKKLPALTELIENRTAIPIRALAEIFGVDVHYENGVITLVRKAHQDYRIGFATFEGQLLPAFDYSLSPNVYVGYAKDYLTAYPKGEGNTVILAVSQPGQELMIQSIEVKEDRIIVHVLPENRWSNAPEGTMGLVHYGPRRVVKLLDPLPEGLRFEVDGYERPMVAVRQAQELTFTEFGGRLELSSQQLKEAGALKQLVTTNGAQELVLVASLGEQMTGGYAIKVLWVEKAEDRLIIHAQATTPTPGTPVIQVITYPYETVVVDRTYADWNVELDLIEAVAFTRVDGLPISNYELMEQGVIKTVGTDGKLLLTACAGEKPNPGYGLQVQWVGRENNRLIVHAKASVPSPDSVQAQVITYPRDVVSVDGAYSSYAVQLVIR